MDKSLSRMSKAQLIDRIYELQSRVAHTDRARVELRDTEERIRAILQTAVEGIITNYERGIIETVNPAVEKMFGYTANELGGKNVSVLMPSPYRQQHDGYLHNYRTTGRAEIIGIGREVVGQRKDGTVFPMDLSVGEVRLAGSPAVSCLVCGTTPRTTAGKKG